MFRQRSAIAVRRRRRIAAGRSSPFLWVGGARPPAQTDIGARNHVGVTTGSRRLAVKGCFRSITTGKRANARSSVLDRGSGVWVLKDRSAHFPQNGYNRGGWTVHGNDVPGFVERVAMKLDRKPVAIVQMGLPPVGVRQRVGDQVDWFSAALRVDRSDVLAVAAERGQRLPALDAFSVAVITGSWSMVTDRPEWSERVGHWALELIARGKPLLGVCYGHQLMAQTMGGRVDYLEGGREQGVFDVCLSSAAAADPLFGRWPVHFSAYLSHSQSVVMPPVGAVVLGGTARDPYQILRYGPNALSVQFHPDFTPAVLQACIADRVERSGDASEKTPAIKSLLDTPQARNVLSHFIELHTKS